MDFQTSRPNDDLCILRLIRNVGVAHGACTFVQQGGMAAALIRQLVSVGFFVMFKLAVALPRSASRLHEQVLTMSAESF